ncbi:MAG TPA: 3-hydroxyacyl-ACP dehydratase FabZ, partial [Devosia sp.]|nr:3-hydroxyacyl-ACP dehydratase FabZ [Devosia sp.]
MDAKTDPSPSESKELTSIDIDRILQLLPHRYPFLMIDRIIEVDSDDSAIGIKNVSVNEPIFQGHFPGNPVFPGVLIIEGMAQTAGAIAIAADQTKGRHVVYMVTVDKC